MPHLTETGAISLDHSEIDESNVFIVNTVTYATVFWFDFVHLYILNSNTNSSFIKLGLN